MIHTEPRPRATTPGPTPAPVPGVRDARGIRAALRLATIRVRDLRLRTYIGFNPDERVKRQDVVIDMTIAHRLDAGALDDDVDRALDYKVITKAVIDHVENGRFLLLEKLAADVLTICAGDPRVRHARVRVDKPHALRFADSVSVTLEFDADITTDHGGPTP